MNWRAIGRTGVPMLLAGVAFAVFAAFGTRLKVDAEDAWRVFAGFAAVVALASGLCPRRRRLRAAAGIVGACFIIGYGYAAWRAGGVGSYSVWVQIAWAASIAWTWGKVGDG